MKILFVLALLLLNQPGKAAEAPLGRLFHSATQRARLDTLRQQNVAVDNTEQGNFTINGEVKRSSGQDTYWLNNQPQSGQRHDRAMPIGDSTQPGNGEPQSLLGEGWLQIKRAKP